MDRYATSTLARLVDDLGDEIVRRDVAYAQRFTMPVPELTAVRARHPSAFAAAPAEVVARYGEGLARLAARGLRLEEREDTEDPLGWTIAAGVLDAARADLGLLELAPEPQDPRPLLEVLRDEFDEHVLPEGRRCFVARRPGVPLLLVNALGFAIDFWRPLLVDRASAFRPVVVEARYGGLFTGGMRTAARLDAHADDLRAALDVAGLERVAVMGWCNGGRVAVDFVARYPERTGALVLLAPTFRGAPGTKRQPPSAFEENIEHLLRGVAATPKLAPTVGKMLRQLFKEPDWDRFSSEAARAAALLSLPDRSLSELMLTALSTATDVLNTVQRNALDEAFPILESLAEVRAPLVVVQGDNDCVVSNAQTDTALAAARAPLRARLRGAGHYLQHQQYRYLRHLLCASKTDASLRLRNDSARITVMTL